MRVAPGKSYAVKPAIMRAISHAAHPDEVLLRYAEKPDCLVLVFRRPPSQRARRTERIRMVLCEREPTLDGRDYIWRPHKEVRA